MLNNLNILAVIPARGGSKGIPRKNLRKVAGLSLIARAAQTAKALDWINSAIIFTDDPDMDEFRVIIVSNFDIRIHILLIFCFEFRY